jgi:hypothetical protein
VFWCGLASAQVSLPQARTRLKDDIGPSLVEPKVWQEGELPGAWRTVSARSRLRIRELRTEQPAFGYVPQNVQAFLVDDKLQRIVVTYLDAGFFFADGTGSTRDFAKAFKKLEKGLPVALAEATDSRGRQVRQGKGEMRTRTTEFVAGELSLRLLCEDDLLVSLTVQPSETAGRDWQTGDLPSRRERRKLLAARVKRSPNGDVAIEGVPINDQHERGYCVVSALAMVMQYHGLAVDVDLLAAKAGYREGDVAKADWVGLFRAAAQEAKLKLTESRRFSFRQVRKSIDRGEPVLVGRAFSRERDAFHREFALRYAQDPTVTLPNPRSKEGRADRKQWPDEKDGPGHMSVITGYNETRGEILFTESWGERYRQRRMSIGEMEKTADSLFFFGL